MELPPAPALAQVEPERCPRFIARDEARVIPAAFEVAQLQDGEVRLTFLGHASFLIESPLGVTIVTDYSDATRPPEMPTIATMNRAHISHYTFNPDPGIRYVLPGWARTARRRTTTSPSTTSGSATSPPMSAAALASRASSSAT